MNTYPLKSLIIIFEDLFPFYKNSSNIYYPLGSNSIKIVTRETIFVFIYYGSDEWSLNTIKYNDHFDKEVMELRRQLTISQKRLKNR